MRRQFGKTIVEIARQDPQVVPGYAKYSVTDSGTVLNNRTGKVLRSRLTKNGYPIVGLWNNDATKKKTCYVHKLVANIFIGPCPTGLEVNHCNGDKQDCHVSNLEYVTKARNIQHSIEIGKRTYPTGTAHAMFGRRGADNPRYGTRHTPKSLEKMSAAKRGEKNPMYGTISPNRRKNA